MMPKIKKTHVLLILLLCVVSAGPLCAQQTPEDARQEAVDNVKVALKLVSQAQKMVSGPTTRENVRAAIDLYVEAGRTFERSEAVFRALGSKYISQDDLDNCVKAKEDCIDAIRKLKESLNN